MFTGENALTIGKKEIFRGLKRKENIIFPVENSSFYFWYNLKSFRDHSSLKGIKCSDVSALQFKKTWVFATSESFSAISAKSLYIFNPCTNLCPKIVYEKKCRASIQMADQRNQIFLRTNLKSFRDHSSLKGIKCSDVSALQFKKTWVFATSESFSAISAKSLYIFNPCTNLCPKIVYEKKCRASIQMADQRNQIFLRTNLKSFRDHSSLKGIKCSDASTLKLKNSIHIIAYQKIRVHKNCYKSLKTLLLWLYINCYMFKSYILDASRKVICDA